ncbi:hypothetical protein Cni_G06682 [Canna indica]|uniref:Uncharacterized protein n=1 Tax=Canna indica TaxID=4628 RepID=A0AAQ3Q6S4_9LILI|nr:hypothetical protein Cni_G06682 [Canna indica]
MAGDPWPAACEPSLRRTTFEEQNNSKIRQAELDLIKAERELSKIREEAMKLKLAREYDKHVRSRNFKEGDLVFRKIELRRKPTGEGKLVANWEGTYKVIKDIRKGTYKIVELFG